MTALSELAAALDDFNTDWRDNLAADRASAYIPARDVPDVIERVGIELEAGRSLREVRRRYGW